MYLDSNKLRDETHADNVKAGWWTNIKTGESILETRNRPEMLALIGSELIEAYVDGYQPDGHLPQFPAYHVEIADTAIRVLDLAGADKIDLESGAAEVIVGNPNFDILTCLVLVFNHALEAYRKSNTEKYHLAIANLYATLFEIARVQEFDLMEVIEAKKEYNRNRADHKVENRVKEGGKVC